MCGIAGCYQQPDGHKLADVMTDRIAHRGPDAGRRLEPRGRPGQRPPRPPAAVDHRPVRRRRPAAVKDGLTIVYNGELYNYKELRAELAGRGVRFATNSDTEVVLEAWRCWGPAGAAAVPRHVRVRAGRQADRRAVPGP